MSVPCQMSLPQSLVRLFGDSLLSTVELMKLMNDLKVWQLSGQWLAEGHRVRLWLASWWERAGGAETERFVWRCSQLLLKAAFVLSVIIRSGSAASSPAGDDCSIMTIPALVFRFGEKILLLFKHWKKVQWLQMHWTKPWPSSHLNQSASVLSSSTQTLWLSAAANERVAWFIVFATAVNSVETYSTTVSDQVFPFELLIQPFLLVFAVCAVWTGRDVIHHSQTGRWQGHVLPCCTVWLHISMTYLIQPGSVYSITSEWSSLVLNTLPLTPLSWAVPQLQMDYLFIISGWFGEISLCPHSYVHANVSRVSGAERWLHRTEQSHTVQLKTRTFL